MKEKNKLVIFLVDDDAVFLKSLEIEFLSLPQYEVKTFSTGELCLANLGENPNVVILDYQLDGIQQGVMNGIETLDKIKLFNAEIPVVILSSQDKIEVAVNCMKHKAFDYVVKSETAFTRLQTIIPTILNYQKLKKELDWYMDRM